MYKALFMALVFLIVNVNLSAQQLMRQTDGQIAVALSTMPETIYACAAGEKMTVQLFKKINKSEEKTCSGINTWDKVAQVIVARDSRALFSEQTKGIYKAEIKLKYQCSTSASRIVAQLLTTNTLQETAEGTKEAKQSSSAEIVIYPNPSLDKFILNIGEEGLPDIDYILKVYAANGALLFEKNIPFSSRQYFEIDLKEFPAGQYTFSVWQGERALGNNQAFKINQ